MAILPFLEEEEEEEEAESRMFELAILKVARR